MRILVMALLLFPMTALADPLILDSGTRQVQLIELYTSQGCSSCPPAEAWLSQLKNRPALWRDFVPVAFHVDYWDFLGWKDPFSKAQYSQRQKTHRAQGNITRVYTPGFVVDGREWYGFFGNRNLPQLKGETGRLTVRLEEGRLEADFESEPRALQLQVAVLGFGLESDVSRGENKGRRLQGDFVVLAHQVLTTSAGHWSGAVTTSGLPKAERYGLAVWVTEKDRLKPLQVVGGWLP